MPIVNAAVHVLVHGRVQGVGYRYFVQSLAETLGLVGWVRNVSEGQVEAYVEGSRPVIETWIERLEKGPPMARVEHIKVDWQDPQHTYASFSIIS